MLILRGHKVSLQNGLNAVFESLKQLRRVPTASAFCQARQKLKPSIFIELNRLVCEEYYKPEQLEPSDNPDSADSADSAEQGWRGRRVLGFDGTYVNVPDTPELRKAFSVQTNQLEHGQRVQALAGVLYDVYNDIGLASDIGPKQGEQDILMSDAVWSATQPSDVLVMDRNFVDFALIAWAVKHNRDVVIRCPTNGFTAIQAFWKTSERERVVTLSLPLHPNTRRFVRKHRLPESVQVRLMKFALPNGGNSRNGDTEMLLTTLCDAAAFPTHEFYSLYAKRWNQETYFDRIKNIFELERFSGTSEHTIRQDFFGVIFLATLEGALTQPTQVKLQAQDERRHTQTRARVNRVISYVALVNHVVALFADPSTAPEQTLEDLQYLFAQTPTRHRTGRRYQRPALTASRKLRFHRYTKRIIA